MRLQVLYDTDKVPIGYRMMIVSLIKEALKLGNKKYYEKLYDPTLKKMKPFSIAPYLQNFQFTEEIIALEGLNITISSPDQEFCIYLYNGLLQLNTFKYKGFSLKKNKSALFKRK